MDKLISAEEMAGEWLDAHQGRMWGSDPESLTRLIQDDREAHEKLICERVEEALRVAGFHQPAVSIVLDAICSAVAKPPETTRERLGRKLYDEMWYGKIPNTEWDDLDVPTQKIHCDRAAVVQAELAKIQEEDRSALDP